MHGSWVKSARRELLAWRGTAPGWPYRRAGRAYAEPTALAILALAGSDSDERRDKLHDGTLSAARWLASLQQADGAVGLSSDLPAPHWTTALAMLAWRACGTFDAQCDRAAAWVLAHPGETHPRSAETPFGHDTTIPGWSWVAGTHSWLEPTALAVLALAGAGRAGAAIDDGRRLIRDRAIRGGGWNYGNSRAFDSDLRPQPAPTGLALLALAATDLPDEPCVEQGCAYLEEILPRTRAAQSLCWGILALSAWQRRPSDADTWLAEAFERAPQRSDGGLQLSYLLLAADDGNTPLFLSRRPASEEH